MKREIVKAKYQRQLEIYGDLIVAMELLKEELKQFDGKQITVRIVNKLNEKDFFRGRYIRIANNIVGKKTILISSIFDRCVNVDGFIVYIYSNDVELLLQEERGDKFNYNFILKEIDNYIKSYKKSIASINYTLENMDTMIKEYNEIKESMRTYNDRYDYSLMKDLKMRFEF